jgi:hypothetical protein
VASLSFGRVSYNEYVMEQERVTAMPREEHRTVFRWNDGKEAGHGNGISRDDEFMADCVVVCFFLSRSFYLVFSVYLSLCFLWFLRLSSGWMSSGWMISRWMNSVGNVCI